MTQTLSEETCRECQKAILVAEYEPHPLEHSATGIAAYIWDEYDTKFVGWICWDCAVSRVQPGQHGTLAGLTQFIY